MFWGQNSNIWNEYISSAYDNSIIIQKDMRIVNDWVHLNLFSSRRWFIKFDSELVQDLNG